MSNIGGKRDNLGMYEETHGMTRHPFYSIWRAMKNRCYSPNNNAFKNYGGRGITVCKEWMESPANFISWLLASGYGKGLQLDRIDNDGDYSPKNCRVVTASENAKNKSNTVTISLHGAERLLIDVAQEYGIKYATLRRRLYVSGMTPEEAVAFKTRPHVKKSIFIDGVEMGITQAAEVLNVNANMLYQRIYRGVELPLNAILVGG